MTPVHETVIRSGCTGPGGSCPLTATITGTDPVKGGVLGVGVALANTVGVGTEVWVAVGEGVWAAATVADRLTRTSVTTKSPYRYFMAFRSLARVASAVLRPSCEEAQPLIGTC